MISGRRGPEEEKKFWRRVRAAWQEMGFEDKVTCCCILSMLILALILTPYGQVGESIRRVIESPRPTWQKIAAEAGRGLAANAETGNVWDHW